MARLNPYYYDYRIRSRQKRVFALVAILEILLVVFAIFAFVGVNLKLTELSDKISEYEKLWDGMVVEIEHESPTIAEVQTEPHIFESSETEEEETETETETEPEKKADVVNSYYMQLPENVETDVKFFTDYRVYNIIGTPHNKLQGYCYTDSLGMRRYNDDYVVALGSYYSTKIGDRFEVSLENGNTFTIILGDGKADADTDAKRQYTPCVNYDGENCGNVLEFIIDKNVISDECFAYGSVNYLPEFKGNVLYIKYLGRADGDWDTYL